MIDSVAAVVRRRARRPLLAAALATLTLAPSFAGPVSPAVQAATPGNKKSAVLTIQVAPVASVGPRDVELIGSTVNPADPKNYPNGIPEGEEFDAVCQQFQWSQT